MNEFQAFTQPVFKGYHAMIRFAEDGQPEPVKGKGGNAIVYATELDAYKAATAHILAYLNGHLRNWQTDAQSEGDRVLAKLGGVSSWVKQRGRDKQIKVEIVRRRVGG